MNYFLSVMCVGFCRSLESDKLTVKNLLKATKKVKEWKAFGHILGINREVLRSIDESQATPEIKKAQMFDHWLETDPHASWNSFSTALEDAGHGELSTTPLSTDIGGRVDCKTRFTH